MADDALLVEEDPHPISLIVDPAQAHDEEEEGRLLLDGELVAPGRAVAELDDLERGAEQLLVNIPCS